MTQSRDPAQTTAHGSGNRLLDALPPGEREAFLERVERKSLEPGEVVYEAGARVAHVWFPVNGVVSLLTTLSGGKAIETATIGREGVVGVAVFLGDDFVPHSRGVIQMRGELFRMDADLFRAQLAGGGKMPEYLLAYTRALMLHFAQGVACAAAHTVCQRLARWLLHTTDRTASDHVELTQQFLSEVLGVRRASVTEAVRDLEHNSAIESRRGSLDVVERRSLEAAACECYHVVREEYARLLPSA